MHIYIYVYIHVYIHIYMYTYHKMQRARDSLNMQRGE